MVSVSERRFSVLVIVMARMSFVPHAGHERFGRNPSNASPDRHGVFLCAARLRARKPVARPLYGGRVEIGIGVGIWGLGRLRIWKSGFASPRTRTASPRAPCPPRVRGGRGDMKGCDGKLMVKSDLHAKIGLAGRVLRLGADRGLNRCGTTC